MVVATPCRQYRGPTDCLQAIGISIAADFVIEIFGQNAGDRARVFPHPPLRWIVERTGSPYNTVI